MVDATFPLLLCGGFDLGGFIFITGQGSTLIPLILVLSRLQSYSKEVYFTSYGHLPVWWVGGLCRDQCVRRLEKRPSLAGWRKMTQQARFADDGTALPNLELLNRLSKLKYSCG
jgi:hypothetical protein